MLVRNYKRLFISCALTLLLGGCASGAQSPGGEIQSPEPARSVAAQETELPSAHSGAAGEKPSAPAEAAVLAAREQALADMDSAQIDRLNRVIREANLWWEHQYLYNNIFEKLSDPDSLYWNYFDQTGEIQIGWAVDGGLDMASVCREEGLTEEAFYSKYASRVVDANPCDAEDFAAILDGFLAAGGSEDLAAALESLREEILLARDLRSMEHANNAYKALHDLDYFLLRYGPADVGPYVTDDSTVSTYYGTLSVYA